MAAALCGVAAMTHRPSGGLPPLASTRHRVTPAVPLRPLWPPARRCITAATGADGGGKGQPDWENGETWGDKPGLGTVEKLNRLEKELQAMFAEGASPPLAKVVSQYRREIKQLRDALMAEVEDIMDGLGGGAWLDGTDISHVITRSNEAEKARAAMRGMEKQFGPDQALVRMSEEERAEISCLEEENAALRQRANAALMRMQYLEDIKKQQGKIPPQQNLAG
mmetsp:Transcript_46391/g.117494  ORF Transcript_46391/g.117494 Transcript_46391/m.117494 type:complete len:223 (+) Transcript_46391:188-856(+)|eukprot:jgi/Tetstr1/421615/TSEL_012556.t1